MSQITYYDNGGVVPPGTAVVTVTGNTGGAVAPDGAGNINVLGPTVPTIINNVITTENGFLSVTGNPGTNTLTVAPINTVQVVEQTTDDTETTVFSLTIDENEAALFTVKFIAALDDYSESLGGTKWATASRPTGLGTNLSDTSGTTAKTVGILPDTDFNFDVSGNDIVFVVKGEAAENFNWKLQIEYILLGKAS